MDNHRSPGVSISLFCEPRLLTAGGSAIRVKSQKAALLLAYLAHFSKRHHSRERLVELLWPDSEDDSARARLRNVLSELRRVLESAGASPDQVITATRTSIEFVPRSVETDVERFELLLKEANNQDPESAVPLLNEAVELSASEFCSTLYDDWVIVERTRLLHLRHAALKRLASDLLILSRNAEAEEAARTLLREDPASETAHNTIISVRIASGDYAGARRQHAALEQVLREELGATPSAESNNLIASIPPSTERPSNRATREQRQPAGTAAAMPAPVSPFTDEAMPFRRAPRRAIWGGPYGLVALALLVVGGWATATRKLPARQTRPAAASPSGSTSANSHNPVWSFQYAPLPDELNSEPTAVAGTPDGGTVVTGFVRTKHNDVDYLTFKLSADGKLVWRKRFNGTGNDVDRARAIFIDGPGDIYVTGESDNGKGNGLSRLAGLDIVTVKYDKDGNQLWANRLNGPADGDDRPLQFVWGGGKTIVIGTVEAKPPGGVRHVPKTVVVAYSAEGKEVYKHIIDEMTPDAARAVSMTSEEDGTVMVCEKVTTTTKRGQEDDIATTYLSAAGKVISTHHFGKGNGTDDVPLRIASSRDKESWVLGIGHTPDMLPTSPRQLMAVKYGAAGNFLWARPLRVDSRRIERIWSTSGSRFRQQSILSKTLDHVGRAAYLALTANMEGAIESDVTISPSALNLYDPYLGTSDGLLLTNSPGRSSWLALPVNGGASVAGNGPANTLTARYDSSGTLIWKDNFGEPGTAEEPRALGFGADDTVFVAGQWCDYSSSKIPPSTIVLKYSQ